MNRVNLIAVTNPLIIDENGQNMTANDFIAYCARVSNPTNQMNNATSSKLIRYCLRKRHWSIFEMVDVVMEIETTRDIGRQILRHRSFSFQEFSQRYADPTQLGVVTREARMQDTENRQNSIEITYNDGDRAALLVSEWEDRQSMIARQALDDYHWALKNGIAKEQARAVLPEGLTMSRMYMKGSLRSWITYCDVRRGPETQKEHREIANACWDVLKTQFTFLEEYNNAI
jgi:thymidylate synthase (FAD)